MELSHAPTSVSVPLPTSESLDYRCETAKLGDDGPSGSDRQLTLLSLPRELRDKIYNFTIEHGLTSRAQHSPVPVPAICLVNRQMRNESLSYYLANARWEFDVRKVPYGKGQLSLLKEWLTALGEDARHLARIKLICQLKHYRWEVYISLVADREKNGARNVEVDERDERGLWPGAVGIIAFNGADRTQYRAMFPGYAPNIWKRYDASLDGPNGSMSYEKRSHDPKSLQDEINEYIEEFIVRPLSKKRWGGNLAGDDIITAIERLLAYEWLGF